MARPIIQSLHAALAVLAAGCSSASGQMLAEPLREGREGVAARFDALNRPPPTYLAGWELRPSLVATSGYDSNLNAAPQGAQESAVVGLRGSLAAERQWGPAVITAEGDLGHRWAPRSRANDQTTAGVLLRGRIDAGDNLTLRGAIGIRRGIDPAGAGDEGVVDGTTLDPYIRRPQFWRVPLEVAADWQVGDWTLSSSASATFNEYNALRTQSGLWVEQPFRNGWEANAGVRIAHRITDTVGVLLTATASERRYDDPQADNRGLEVLAGAELEYTRLLLGELTLGWASQSYAVSGDTSSAFTYGAKLTWFAHPLAALVIEADRDFRAEQTVDLDGLAVTTPVLRDAVSLRLELEAWRTGLVTMGIAFEQNKSDDGARDDQLTRFDLGLTYAMTRLLQLQFGYGYSVAETILGGTTERNMLTLELHSAF